MNSKSRYIKAEEIYKNSLRKVLEKRHKGKIIAIDIDSEQYFIGDCEISAYEKAQARNINKPLCFLRVGSEMTDYIGRFK